MTDSNVFGKISELASEEHELWAKESRSEATDADRARLKEIAVLLDQCWDLLHQRRGLRDANLDPDEAVARPAKVVENYTTEPYDGRSTDESE